MIFAKRNLIASIVVVAPIAQSGAFLTRKPRNLGSVSATTLEFPEVFVRPDLTIRWDLKPRFRVLVLYIENVKKENESLRGHMGILT